MTELINRNKLGVAKETELEQAVDGMFMGETSEVGLYLAMSRQAQREGFPEIAEVLKSIAWDEAWHGARYAELGGKISESTKENLEKMLKGEISANIGKRQVAVQAKKAGIDEAHDAINESSKDEARHAEALKGLLTRYF